MLECLLIDICVGAGALALTAFAAYLLAKK
jgi:hypothetical protein